jgi:allantoin racemase
MRLLVVNPNSSEFVTEAIRESVAPLEEWGATSHRIDCLGLRGAPTGIETQADVETVIPLIIACVAERSYDAYVLACFSDPGIRLVRRSCGRPVFGIGECAYLQAMSMGEQFGVISTRAEAVARHRRYLDELGFADRLAGDLPLNLGVAELAASAEITRERVHGAARALVAKNADVLILGCAGLGRYGPELREVLGKPVIEPTVAAVQLALASSCHM